MDVEIKVHSFTNPELSEALSFNRGIDHTTVLHASPFVRNSARPILSDHFIFFSFKFPQT